MQDLANITCTLNAGANRVYFSPTPAVTHAQLIQMTSPFMAAVKCRPLFSFTAAGAPPPCKAGVVMTELGWYVLSSWKKHFEGTLTPTQKAELLKMQEKMLEHKKKMEAK